MGKKCIGLIEAHGLAAAVEAADTAVKSSNVHLLGYEYSGHSGMIVVKIEGTAAAVKSAMDAAAIETVIAPIEGVQIANYNCPGQIVISGLKEAVETAGEKLKEAGAKRVIPLNVSGPFHSRMLTEAGRKLGEVLEKTEVHTPRIPYVANVTAQYVTDAAQVKPLLEQQVYSSVRWQQSVETMLADGVDTFIEIGPGKTLSGFVKKISRDVKVLNIEKMEDLEKF